MVVSSKRPDLNTRNNPAFDDHRHADSDKRAVRQPQLEVSPQVHIHFTVAATSSFRF